MDRDGPAWATVGGRRYEIVPGSPLRIGRTTYLDVIGLDPTDDGISRIALELTLAADGTALARNASSKRTLYAEHPHRVRHATLEPGSTPYRCAGPVRILVPGNRFTHPVDIVAGTGQGGGPPADDAEQAGATGRSTSRGHLSSKERVAVAAVAAGYLARWPRHDENPLGWDDAAALVDDLSTTTLRRRVENARARFAEAGLVVAVGEHATRTFVEYLIDCGLLGVEDDPLAGRGRA